MISKLINKRFHSISRAADMLCLQIGDDFSYISVRCETIDAAEYSLHFQTKWRFRQGDKILLASEDIFEPYGGNVPDDWQYDIVGRPDEQSSVFDVCAKPLAEKMQGTVVTEASLSEANDVVIRFSNGVVFEQFMCSTTKAEEWRLIDFSNNLHTVCYDEDGIISCE